LAKYFSTELARLLAELLLHFEQVPVRTNAREQVVEEVIEILAQVVSNEDHMVPQGYLVLCQILVDL